MRKDREKQRGGAGGETERAALGLESEFACVVGDETVDPAVLFRDPRALIGDDAMHRTGTSYHLPNGGAAYFDTGVIELVTPVIELDRGAPSRAARSLWEGIYAVRDGLDRWSAGHDRPTRLVGFSTHYNVSLPELTDPARIHALGWVLVHMLPLPFLFFTANRRSTGFGVRPRPGRIELTVDFTPDPALTAAATALATAAVRDAAGWARLDLTELVRRGYPLLRTLTPIPHTSRKGWLVQAQCLATSPFETSPDEAIWELADGSRASMREIGRRVTRLLERELDAIAAPDTVALIRKILAGHHPSLLDLDDRPATYEDVGRLRLWREPRRPLPRSLYEQVMLDATARVPLLAEGRRWLPVATRGWTRVLYERDDGRRRLFSVDELVRLRRR